MKKERKKYSVRIRESLEAFPDELLDVKEHVGNYVNISSDFENVYRTLINLIANEFEGENDFYEVLDKVLHTEKYRENIHLRRTLNLSREFDFISDILSIDNLDNAKIAAKSYGLWSLRDYSLDLFSEYIDFLVEENKFKGAFEFEKRKFNFITNKMISSDALADLEVAMDNNISSKYNVTLSLIKFVKEGMLSLGCYYSPGAKEDSRRYEVHGRLLSRLDSELIDKANELYEARKKCHKQKDIEMELQSRERLALAVWGEDAKSIRGVRESKMESLVYLYAFSDIKENISNNALSLSKLGLIDSEKLMSDFQIDGDITMYPILKLESLVVIEIMIDCLSYAFTERGQK